MCYFGTNEEIYTPNQIMRTALNRAAITINEIFCKSVSYPTLSWDELDDFHRESKITAADHLLMKIRILLEDETLTDFSADTVEKAYATVRRKGMNPCWICTANWIICAGSVSIPFIIGVMERRVMMTQECIRC